VTARRSDDVSVTMLGSLPPWRAITPYCREVFEGLESEGADVEFLNWRQLYPRRFYPGGDPRDDTDPPSRENVHNVLTWWNPLTWLHAGLLARGDVLHAQWWSFPLVAVYLTVSALAKLRGRTVVVTVHNVQPHEQSWLSNTLNRLVYHVADAFVVHSAENRETLCRTYGIDEADVTVINHPIIQSVPKRGLSADEAKDALGIDRDRDVLLSFGSIREYKGLDTLLEQMPAVVENHEDALFVVAGACWDDWETYQRIIDREGLAPHVRTDVGYVGDDDVELYFAANDVTVFPYRHFEAQSGVASLANYFGVYSLGFDRGGLGEQLSETVDSNEALVARLVELLAAAEPPRPTGSTDNDQCIADHLALYRRLAGDEPESRTQPRPVSSGSGPAE
jgi:glycosyltransferase involved in cell wall biosynthesis